MADERKIITRHNWITTRGKPQPDEWEAVRDEWDLGDSVGHGATEAEAIADLLEMQELHEDAREARGER